LKGVAWLLDEDASHVGSRRRICAKLFIISFLLCIKDSSSKILKGYWLYNSQLYVQSYYMNNIIQEIWFDTWEWKIL
jgi:hypothetical protein